MEIATTRLSSRGQIVIPSEMRTNFKEGETLVIIKRGDEIIIKKEEQVCKIFADSNLLAKDWLSKEDEEAWKDL